MASRPAHIRHNWRHEVGLWNRIQNKNIYAILGALIVHDLNLNLLQHN